MMRRNLAAQRKNLRSSLHLRPVQTVVRADAKGKGESHGQEREPHEDEGGCLKKNCMAIVTLNEVH